MRYQANGTKPTRRTIARNGSITSADGDEGGDEADRDLPDAVGAEAVARVEQVVRERRAIVGMARKKENSAAAARSRPSAIAPTIVAPERDTPGISASAWHAPIAERAPAAACGPRSGRRAAAAAARPRA